MLGSFHRVKLFDTWRESAGFNAHSSTREKLCLQAWDHIKTAARNDPKGMASGLARYALCVWAENETAGVKTAFTRANREDYATSLASAGAADDAIENLKTNGSLTKEEAQKLASINAIAAIEILEKLSGIPTKILEFAKKHPELIGGAIGSAAGAGLGAYKDDENRLRGSLVGALGGASLGSLIGHGQYQHQKYLDNVRENLSKKLPQIKSSSLRQLAWSKLASFEDPSQNPMGAPEQAMPTQGGPPGMQDPQAQQAIPGKPQDGGALPPPEGNTSPGTPGAPEPLGQSPEEAAAQQQAQQAEQMANEHHQYNTMVDNLSFLAQQVGLPSLSQEIEGTRDQLIQHFSAGNEHLPHNLQKYFPQSEHAKQFIEKYKARFAPITGGSAGKKGGGSKKASAEENESRLCDMHKQESKPVPECDECCCKHGRRMNEPCKACHRITDPPAKTAFSKEWLVQMLGTSPVR